LEKFESNSGVFIFRMEPREYTLFKGILSEYPLQQIGEQRISADSPPDEVAEEQKLLEDSLEEYRDKMRDELDKFLSEEDRLAKDEHGWTLTLDVAGIDWLLQILNDIRVGSWVELGRPEPESPVEVVTPEQLRRATALQFCGMWQSILLNALETGEAI
jgi:hypothetical protein